MTQISKINNIQQFTSTVRYALLSFNERISNIIKRQNNYNKTDIYTLSNHRNVKCSVGKNASQSIEDRQIISTNSNVSFPIWKKFNHACENYYNQSKIF